MALRIISLTAPQAATVLDATSSTLYAQYHVGCCCLYGKGKDSLELDQEEQNASRASKAHL